MGEKGILAVIFDFIKSWEQKGDLSPAEWIESEFVRRGSPDGKGGVETRQKWHETARDIVQSIEDYETAKKDLQAVLDRGGNAGSWLGDQMVIGAAENGASSVEEYAAEIAAGLDEAAEENTKSLPSGEAENHG